MSVKSKLPSRFLFYLFSISIFLLIFSFASLVQYSNTSLIPRSVFKRFLLNSSSMYSNPNVILETIKIPFVSQTDTKLASNSERLTCAPFGALKNQTEKSCDPRKAVLRVYMYDLPPEFHFGLLGWKAKVNEKWPIIDDRSNIPSYPGGLNLQHSMEYWLTLDLLASNRPVVRSCSAVRVENSSQADIIFVPFFSSLSYNRHSKVHEKKKVSVNKILQSKLVQFLLSQDEWKRNGGKDHLIVAHHPNSMLDARKKLGSAMFILADFGRYPAEIANLRKDIIAPYKHVVRTIPSVESPKFEQRPILAYFQGAIYRKDGGVIRQELYYLLKDEKDVHFTFGTTQANGIRMAGQGMASSKFCLNIAGDTPSSNRLFDAIVSQCVPVIISDEIELPFEDILDYSEFCVFVHASDAVKPGYLVNLIRGIGKVKWTKMWEKLKEIAPHFEFHYPSKPGDAVDMIWEAVFRKISSVQFNINRRRRYYRSELAVKSA